MPQEHTPPIDHELVASAHQMARSDLSLSLLLYNRYVLSAGGFPVEPQNTVSEALREQLRNARRDLLEAMALETALADWANSF